MPIKLTQQQFIQQSISVHNDRYNYSLVDYKNNSTKIKIICKIHGIFEQMPSNHLRKSGCPKCSNEQKSSASLFIQRAQRVHNKYDYSLVEYKNNKTKVKIICPIHGIFEQKPNNHLSLKNGCPLCSGRQRSSTAQFIKKAIKIHNNKYDYSLVEYINVNKKVTIVCPIHGPFEQRPNNHITSKRGCNLCAQVKKSKKMIVGNTKFIERANKLHKFTYDYSLVEYVNGDVPVKIICKKHGAFQQTPGNHIHNIQGCPKCSNWISKPEIKWLDNHNVPDTPNNRQVLISISNKRYKVDGYIPETRTIYEFYGDFWHGNPKIYNVEDVNPVNYKTFGELYQKTLDKRQAIINAGYNLIEMWESEFK